MSDEALKQSHAALLNALECMVENFKPLVDPNVVSDAFALSYYIEMAEDAIEQAKKI